MCATFRSIKCSKNTLTGGNKLFPCIFIAISTVISYGVVMLTTWPEKK